MTAGTYAERDAVRIILMKSLDGGDSWVPVTNPSAGGGGGVTTYAALTDVDLTGLDTGDLMQYDSVAGKWVIVDPAGVDTTALHSGTVTGDVTGTVPGALTLKNTGPGATGPIGDATHVAAVTIDAQGRATALSSVAIALPESAITNLTTDLAAKLVKASNLSDLANAGTARTNLGVAIGTNVEAWDADLDAIAALDSSTSGAIASDGAGWIKKSYAQFKTALGLVKADVGLGNVDNTADSAKTFTESQVTNLTTDLAAKQSTTLTSAHLLVGNGSNVATDVALSGDATLANTGALTLASVVGAGSVGAGNLVPVLTYDAKGRITGVTTAAVSIPHYGAVDLYTHSYGTVGGNDYTYAVDTFVNIVNRVAGLAQVEKVLIIAQGGGQLSAISRGVSGSGQGIGEYFNNIYPSHIYAGGTGFAQPKQASKAKPGLAMTLLGINDPVRDWPAAGTQVVGAYTHHVRSGVARRRARAIYAYNDAAITYTGTWTNVTTDNASFGNVKRTSTNADSLSYAIPTSFLGGYIDLVVWANPNGLALLNGAINNSTTSIPVKTAGASQVRDFFPQAGNFVIQIDSEQMLVTAGQGTGAGTFTVTRAHNGTAAAAHSDGASVTQPTTTGLITLGGTSGAAGTFSIAGQGCAGTRCAVTKRISLTAAAAGTTLTATVSGLVASETLDVDSILFEDADPPTHLLINQPNMDYSAPTATFFTGTNVTAFNGALTTVQAEFDSSVVVVDIATTIANLYGATIQTATSTGTTIHITPVLASANLTAKGSILRCGGEEMLVTSAVTKTSNTDWSMTVTRAYAGTDTATGAAATVASVNHAIGAGIFDVRPWSSDRVHPSDLGGVLYAASIFTAIGTAPQTSNQIGTAGAYNPVVPSIDNNQELFTVGGTRTTQVSANSANGWLQCSRVEVRQPCVITALKCEVVTTAASAGGVARMGVWKDIKGLPGQLVVEADNLTGATADLTSTGIKTLTCFKPIEPGFYWVGSVQQGGATTRASMRSTTDVRNAYQTPLAPGTSPLGSAFSDTNGVRYNGQTGALASLFGVVPDQYLAGAAASNVSSVNTVTMLVNTQNH